MFDKQSTYTTRAIVSALALFGLCTSGQMATAQISPQDEIAKTDAQIQIMRKRNELQSELQRYVGTASTSIPQVLAVIGLEGDMVARLQQQNGAVANFREGETISADMKVASITPRQVTLMVGRGKKSKAVALDFAAGAGPGMMNPGGNGRPVMPELLPDPPFVGVPPLPKALMSTTPPPASTAPAIVVQPVPPVATAAPVPIK